MNRLTLQITDNLLVVAQETLLRATSVWYVANCVTLKPPTQPMRYLPQGKLLLTCGEEELVLDAHTLDVYYGGEDAQQLLNTEY